MQSDLALPFHLGGGFRKQIKKVIVKIEADETKISWLLISAMGQAPKISEFYISNSGYNN